MADPINTRAAQVLAALPAGEAISVTTLQAAHAELSRHQARRVLQRLEADGAIARLDGRGPRGAVLYQLAQETADAPTQPPLDDDRRPRRARRRRIRRPASTPPERSRARRTRSGPLVAAPALPPRQVPPAPRPLPSPTPAPQALTLGFAALAPLALLYLPLIAALLVGPRLPGAARTTAAAVSGAARAYGALVRDLGATAIALLEAPSHRHGTASDRLTASLGGIA